MGPTPDGGAGGSYTIQALSASSVVNGTYTLVSTSKSGLYSDATTAVISYTLPAASTTDKIFIFKKIDSSANTVTVNRAGSDTIDGATSVTLSNQYDWVMIQSDGSTAWKVIGRTVPSSGVAPAGASYVVISNDATLTAERALTMGNNIKETDAGANSTVTLQIYAATSISATNTLLATTVETIWADATSASFTITLPAASSTDKRYNIKKIDSSANTVTIQRAGSDTIDGATTQVLTVQYQAFELQADGSTKWYLL